MAYVCMKSRSLVVVFVAYLIAKTRNADQMDVEEVVVNAQKAGGAWTASAFYAVVGACNAAKVLVEKSAASVSKAMRV